MYGRDGSENYTTYAYDKVGNKISMTTANGEQTTTYEYDKRLNRLIKLTDPMGEYESYTYDISGNLIQKTDRNGKEIKYTYNGLDKVLTEEISGGSKTTYKYGPTGDKISEKNQNIETTFKYYEDSGWLKTEKESTGVTKEYKYDLCGNRISFVLKKGSVAESSLSYGYDSLNRLKSVSDGGVETANYEYDANGNRTKMKYPGSDIETEYTYNNANLVKTLSNKKGASAISSYNYTYYYDGNMETSTDNKGTKTTYVYDGMGRLASETAGADSKSYAYNSAGNRSSMTVTGRGAGRTDYIYDHNNRLLKETSVPTGKNYTETFSYRYDNNGNQLVRSSSKTKPELDGDVKIGIYTADELEDYVYEENEYDQYNRVVKSVTNKATAKYTYRPDGLRLTKEANGVKTTHIWDGSNMAAELNSAGKMTNRYVRGINLIKGEFDNTEKYYVYNAHGDVVQLTDSSGYVIKNYEYDAFGVELGKNTSGKLSMEGSAYINITENNFPDKISYTPTWIDPIIVVNVGQITNSKVEVTLKITANEESVGQIFWCTQDSYHTEEKSVRFTVKPGTHDYTIDLGKISVYLLRIDVGVQGSPVTLSNIRLNVEEDSNPWRYCGEYTDLETNTIYLRNRYYNPTTSRFLTEDPIRAGLNWYTYANNNPLKYIDPSGLLSKEQYGSFMKEVGAELGRSTLDNVKFIINPGNGAAESLLGLYEIGVALANQEITLDDVKTTMGENAWNSILGDLSYIRNNYEMFSPDVTLTASEVKELAVGTVGALQEAVDIGATIYGVGSGAKALVKAKGAGSTVDGLIKGAKETTNKAGVARNFEKTGGYNNALNEFNSLKPTDVKGIQTQYGSGKTGVLSDGTKITVRPGSNTGGSTLEIKISNSKLYKIRYGD